MNSSSNTTLHSRKFRGICRGLIEASADIHAAQRPF